MKLLYGTNNLPVLKNGTVATIGNFDGVHLGHRALLLELQAVAQQMQLPTVVILFEPQPAEYFHGEAPIRLSTLREKLTVLRRMKIDYVYCIKFDKRLALMPAERFVDQFLFSLLHVNYLLIGQDFRFGNNREGDVALLKRLAKKNGLKIDVFSDFELAGERISSTKVRMAIQNNQLAQAAELLGRRYSFCGRVIYGAQRGRQWGIPTANIGIHRKSLSVSGIYCVLVKRSNKRILKGVANVGNRPTVDGTKNILEVHILDFNESLYGEFLEIVFLHKLRDEVKFSSLEALITQIHEDVAAAKQFFNK